MPDVVVIGAGAAGLFAALAARGVLQEDGSVGPVREGAPQVVLVDGQSQPGRKILIAGGGRCNVTNEVVTADDYWTQRPRLVRNALRSFGPDRTRAVFERLGVPLKVEPLGKVFPESDRARDVLDALLDACNEAGITTRFGRPVENLAARGDGTWLVDDEAADRVVVATGGRSVPATGSTGFGLDFSRSLGHTIVRTVPALAALEGDADDDLAGITVPAIVQVTCRDQAAEVAAGSLLFTHRGVTGPAALDVSSAVELALEDGHHPDVTADLWSLADPTGPFATHLDAPKLPGCCLAEPPAPASPSDLDAELARAALASPRKSVDALLRERLPRRLAAAVAITAGDLGDVPLGQLTRQHRQRLARCVGRWPLRIATTAGYAKAEATRGGVDVAELERGTLESRLAPGLHLCGEVCDVTGRLGGFNFQWAWTSGWLAGRGAGKARRP